MAVEGRLQESGGGDGLAFALLHHLENDVGTHLKTMGRRNVL